MATNTVKMLQSKGMNIKFRKVGQVPPNIAKVDFAE
jgi:hypothetical protein